MNDVYRNPLDYRPNLGEVHGMIHDHVKEVEAWVSRGRETSWTRAVRYRRSIRIPASKPEPPPMDLFGEGVRQTLAIIEDHWPEVVVRVDEGWDLECACGWNGEYIGWYQHLDNAVDEAIGIEARIREGLTDEQKEAFIRAVER